MALSFVEQFERKDEINPLDNDTLLRHKSFFVSLAMGPIPVMAGLEDRGYQAEARESIRKGFLGGEKEGILECGTGGGKTTIALNFLAKTAGKKLWAAPSRTALQRAIDEATALKIPGGFVVLEEGMQPSQLPKNAGLVFTTFGMLYHGQKYQAWGKDHFSMFVADEAHHTMGPSSRKLFDYFSARVLHMTATPGTTVSHLSKFAKNFYRYSSDDLVRNEGFPPWVLRRYEIPDEKIYEAQTIGENYVLAQGQEETLLNMPHRYSICLQILREAVAKGEKVIMFMPSVASSKYFVEKIVALDPLLKGKIFHVDGSPEMKDKTVGLAQQFRLGEKLGASCNMLWAESLDVTDIKHVILCDPCCSARLLFQRIGRGARKAAGKTHLTIHDVVSVFRNTESYGKRPPLSVAGMLGLRKYEKDVVLNGAEAGKTLFSGGVDGVRFVENTKAEMQEIHFTERMIDLGFLGNPASALALYRQFADLFKTPLSNLVFRGAQFAKRGELVELVYPIGKKERITFGDLLAGMKVFGNFAALEKAAREDVASLAAGFGARVRGVMGEALKPQPKALGTGEAAVLPHPSSEILTTQGTEVPDDEAEFCEGSPLYEEALKHFNPKRLSSFLTRNKRHYKALKKIFQEVTKILLAQKKVPEKLVLSDKIFQSDLSEGWTENGSILSFLEATDFYHLVIDEQTDEVVVWVRDTMKNLEKLRAIKKPLYLKYKMDGSTPKIYRTLEGRDDVLVSPGCGGFMHRLLAAKRLKKDYMGILFFGRPAVDQRGYYDFIQVLEGKRETSFESTHIEDADEYAVEFLDQGKGIISLPIGHVEILEEFGEKHEQKLIVPAEAIDAENASGSGQEKLDEAKRFFADASTQAQRLFSAHFYNNNRVACHLHSIENDLKKIKALPDMHYINTSSDLGDGHMNEENMLELHGIIFLEVTANKDSKMNSLYRIYLQETLALKQKLATEKRLPMNVTFSASEGKFYFQAGPLEENQQIEQALAMQYSFPPEADFYIQYFLTALRQGAKEIVFSVDKLADTKNKYAYELICLLRGIMPNSGDEPLYAVDIFVDDQKNIHIPIGHVEFVS